MQRTRRVDELVESGEKVELGSHKSAVVVISLYLIPYVRPLGLGWLAVATALPESLGCCC